MQDEPNKAVCTQYQVERSAYKSEDRRHRHTLTEARIFYVMPWLLTRNQLDLNLPEKKKCAEGFCKCAHCWNVAFQRLLLPIFEHNDTGQKRQKLHLTQLYLAIVKQKRTNWRCDLYNKAKQIGALATTTKASWCMDVNSTDISNRDLRFLWPFFKKR